MLWPIEAQGWPMASGRSMVYSAVILALLILSAPAIALLGGTIDSNASALFEAKPNVAGATPNDITADGDIADWPADTLMATDSNGVDFRLTWNATHLSLAWSGTDWAATEGGADLFVYLNTSSGGNSLSDDWNGRHTLPFDADYAILLEDSSYHAIRYFDGTIWQTTAEENAQMEIHTFPGNRFIGWSGDNDTEITIPWSAIGNPTSVDIIVWSQWQSGQHAWTVFPEENPASRNGAENGAETFTHAYQISDRNLSLSPNTLPKVVSGGVEKRADALNLAIVFHQHQPYYKNKLTGTYEMPWVRVHAMTEYVDSPGILAQNPGTKITYNLVPSFIEQLVDYHRNETPDVHTDFARRTWPTHANGTVSDYPNATERELHTMQFQSFWNSGWIYNVSASDADLGWLYPSSARYAEIYGMTRHNLKPATIMDDTLLSPQNLLDLQVLWYLYQFSPDYVLGEYANLEDSVADGRPAHADATLETLFMQNGDYTPADLAYVIQAQHEGMANVLPMYSALAERGQIELTTTPYYHPIMPLLMQDGWKMEDGIQVDKASWPDDVRTQLNRGMDLFEAELGFRPTGMWPSEQSVSPSMVQPVSEVGVQWMVTDEVILGDSTRVGGGTIDIENAADLATPWLVSGRPSESGGDANATAGEVAVIFRDRVISDRIAFQYGTMSPEAAVSDFIAHIDGVRQDLLDAGLDPSKHMLTVALDGENWMFMSEFQHRNNGRPFMQEWYSRLASHPTIVTTTPSEFLENNTDLPRIETISTGSWIDGTLRTWAGEEEESLGWQRLVEARQALVAFEEANPSHSGLESAWESLYIAEGSDWFWWYGLDQDSGYDELWDTLFKVHLSNIYRPLGLDLPPYLQDLWTNPSTPSIPYGGIIEPLIDGVALPGEWDGAARYDADSIDGGSMDIDAFYLGYDASNVYVRVDLATNGSDWESLDLDYLPDLAIYFMQPNAINFNEVETNFRTYYGNQILGFPAKKMVAFNFDQMLGDDGLAKWNLFDAQGKIGDVEGWQMISTSGLGGCAALDVYEFKIPWSELGLAPRASTRVKVVTAEANSLSYGDGIDAEMAPPAPAEMVMPDLEQWVTLLDIDDVTGDENGDGDYTYPLASDFEPGAGLWDVTHLKVSQSAWNARFEIEMSEMTDIWTLANGFSHQIIQIYVDRGETTYGRTEMLEGANAEIHPDWAWEVAISATGEPGAVKAVDASSGGTSAKGIEVSADSTTNIIQITVSKSVIGNDIPNYRFVIVVGSQDGFGPGKWRDVDATAKTWRLGGGADPASDDGIDYDPNIVEIILDAAHSNGSAAAQAAMLAGYDVAAHQYAQLTGVEIPEVAQQIYGAKVAGVTANGAILEWSTTQPEAAIVHCTSQATGEGEGGDGNGSGVGTDDTGVGTIVSFSENDTNSDAALLLSHTILLSSLSTNTSYECWISIANSNSTALSFNTSAEVDSTPPEILQIRATVLEDGRIKISWYTSENAAENVTIQPEDPLQSGQADASADAANTTWLTGDLVALSKNHELTSAAALTNGVWLLTILATDASGNTNTTTTSVTVAIEGENQPDDGEPDGGDDVEPCASTVAGCENGEVAAGLIEMLDDPFVILAMLVIAVAMVLALIRAGRNEIDLYDHSESQIIVSDLDDLDNLVEEIE